MGPRPFKGGARAARRRSSSPGAGAAVLFIAAIATCAAQASPADALKQQVAVNVDRVAPEIGGIASRIWSFAETGLRERRSAKLLADRLRQEGFAVTQGVADMPTAFVATFGSGAPVIGILAEYDALPGVGNEATPGRALRSDGNQNGHGCGHNLFGAAAVGGAIALKQLIAKHGVRGTIKVFGTPAEEDDVGKLYMAKAGVFNGLDAAIEWHPDTATGTTNSASLALNNFQIEFFGKSAHASAEPERGRSALDASEMTTFGINLLREHVRSTARMHYFVAQGGTAPNIVPDYARLVLNVRDVDRAGVEDAYARVLRIAEGAARAMEVEYKVTLFSALNAVLLNRPLQEAMQANLQLLGPLRFDSSDQDFGRGLQRALGLPEAGFDGTVQALAPQAVYGGGSTDVAEVSRITPTVGFQATSAPVGTPWHAWATTAAHGSSAANKTVAYAAKAIAFMAIDVLLDNDLRQRATEEFKSATNDQPYVPGIPLDQRPPFPAPRQ